MIIRDPSWLVSSAAVKFCIILCILTKAVTPYLLLVKDTTVPGHVIFDSSVYKLGSERHYTINVHRTANFVHHIFHVDPKLGTIVLKKRLRCDGILYPNLFTLYIDSTSNRIRDIDYYSLPIRILIIGPHCGSDSNLENNNHPHDTDYNDEFDNEHLDDEVVDDNSDYESDDSYHREKRSISNIKDIDVRLLEDEEFKSLASDKNMIQRRIANVRSKREVFDEEEDFYTFQMAHLWKSRRRRSFPFDMATHVKLSLAKQWISETYASFAIPTADKWSQICLKGSQFINSLTAFLPKTIQQNCKVTFVDVDDLRFKIESTQGDLVASDDVCIQESIWKVTILFSYACNRNDIVDTDHRLKIVYHHQLFNDTDIAKRVRRELRNQSPFFEQALYVASVAEEQEPGALVTTVRARDPENSPITYSMTSLLDARSQGMFSVDSKLGAVTTLTKLDRELVDVHYFRITAVDDSFPPRSGTTTLQINVLDCNDHTPVFELQEYEATIREGATQGSTVITLKATDQDIGKNSEVEYSIESVTSESELTTPDENIAAFRMDQKNGILSTRSQLDREKASRYSIIVCATDQTSPVSERRTASATVNVRVLDDNDNYPQFSERTYTVSVNEDINLADNPIIAHIRATDADLGANSAIRYAIIGGNTQLQFSIDSLSGDVSLVKPLDYELLRNYRLVIRAQDGGSPSRSNTTQLLINVKDVNDNSPRFYTSLFQEAVSESVPVGYSIVRVQAYDADEGANAELTYSINERDLVTIGGIEKFPLSIDSRTGWIYTVRQLDREEQSKFNFQVIGTDGGIPPRSATASVALTVQDVNDNDPHFDPPRYESNLAEDEPPGTPVVTVTATDPDEDNRLHYELTGGNTRGRFAITSQNGRGLITVAQPLDFKQERRYVLTVTASDSGGRSDTAAVHINITDANNFAPVFENAPYTASVYEDAPIGTTVLVVSATDSDVGINAQITYSIGGENNNEAMSGAENEFIINPQTGAIITNKLLDREITSGYLLTVTARDGGSPSHSDTTDVEISVTDVNDNNPTFKQSMYSSSVLEDALIGTSVIQISATDIDIGLNGRVRYELSTKDREDGSFIIDHSSGVIRTNKGLDRESVPAYDLHAYAVDRGSPSLSTSVLVHVRIEDINDSPPAFEGDKLTLYVAENSPIGTTVGEIHAHDPDEGVNAIVHYSIIGGDDSSSFTLKTRPGSDRAELLTTMDLDYESPHKKYELVIRAASPPLRSDVHVEILVTDVNDNAPILKDFQVIFNNFKDCFPVGVFGKVPAIDADVTDKLTYKILSGNNANLVTLNQTTGGLTLSPQLNTNVPRLATMELSVSDGINEIKAMMQLSVRLITEDMLLNSVTVRLNDMTAEAFLSPLLTFFIDGLAAIIPCPKENIYVFSVQDDTVIDNQILNVSFSARRPDITGDIQFYSPVFLQERVYLNRAILARLATVQVLPFDDNMCMREPCLNFEECLTILKFGNASEFIHSSTVLFRPIYPVTTFRCQCPVGFTGSKEHYLCDAEVNLCYSSPCMNNGTCKRREGGYTCTCSSGFTGVNCETILEKASCTQMGNICKGGSQCTPKLEGGILCQGCSIDTNHTTDLCELRARSFIRTSFLTFPSLKQRYRLHIKLRFATQHPNGLLLYNGRFNERHDFISLEVVGESVQFSFSLGGKVSSVSVAVPGGITKGDWHSVEVSYINMTVTLSVDGCDTALSLAGASHLGSKWACANTTRHMLPERCAILTETCHRFLDLTGPLQIGGLPSLPSSFRVKSKDFIGCISDLYIDHRFIDLNSYVVDNGTIVGCPEKRSYCGSNPCHNGAECHNIWDTYFCECTEGYTGKDCSESITQPWRFNGDGVLSFNPLLRPIQLPWLNALSIRTRQQDTFLMSVQVGQNSSAVISLKSGLLHYTYNSETMFLPGTSLADGEWHRIEIKWLGADISVGIDYGSRVTLLPMSANKIQGLYVGKILIGGQDSISAGNILSADYGYFEGCIQDVRVGSAQSLLNRPTVRENVRDGCHSRADCLLSACPAQGQCRAKWDTTECVCQNGAVGDDCRPVCDVKPCGDKGQCIPDASLPKGYRCSCTDEKYYGEYCDIKRTQTCPSGWWGSGECGPCMCEIENGYHPDCNKTTGKCYCREHHYQPPNSTKCLPCQCYSVGSLGGDCDSLNGQCTCHPGVIGRSCDSCSNTYAEVTPDGCQVIYDGCPRSMAEGVWWARGKFGEVVEANCPAGAGGKGSRACGPSDLRPPWREPNMFNCTSHSFLHLRKQLNRLETGELEINTFVGIKLAESLMTATQETPNLYGADILISEGIIMALIKYENKQMGLNLTHSQDKDYIKNLIKSASKILLPRYSEQWRRIQELTGHSVDGLLGVFDEYITTLGENQHDTYTNPFEMVTDNLALGVDIVTTESIYGFEPTQGFKKHNLFEHNDQLNTEDGNLPDTSSFLHSPMHNIGYFSNGKATKGQKKSNSPMISFPKYNNFLQNSNKFDKLSKVYVPLDILGIKPYDGKDDKADMHSRAVIAYTQWAQGPGSLIPGRCGPSVIRRWGVPLRVSSILMQLEVLVPESVWNQVKSNNIPDTPKNTFSNMNKNNKAGHKPSENDIPSDNLPANETVIYLLGENGDNEQTEHPIIIIKPLNKKNDLGNYINDPSENEATYIIDPDIKNYGYKNDEPLALAYNVETPISTDNIHADSNNKNKLVYKSLNGINLRSPIRLQMWLDIDPTQFNSRMNPQCVHWTTSRGVGEWSRVGCLTEVNYDWDSISNSPILVNCTCNHFSTFTVLVDMIDLEYIPEPSLLEDVSSYSAFCLSLPILLLVLIGLSLVRGGAATISNTIHKNLVFSVFMAELLYFVALKGRSSLVTNEFACKLIAMVLHYWWMCCCTWQAADAWQLRRMVREVRDVNHGPAGAHLTFGYGTPAVIVALAAGVRVHQYGNTLFCWISWHESLVWWVVIPAGILGAACIVTLASAVRAAFTLKDHILGFGNLRSIVCVAVISAPMLSIGGTTCLLLAGEGGGGSSSSVLSLALAAALPIHAITLLLGYVIFNIRVRENLHRTFLRCMGRKVPLLDNSMVTSSSGQPVTPGNRSALAYHNTGGLEGVTARRNIGISASSTTSRSTTKTSSSPYRSDGHMRHTSTSTSNYNSTSDMPSYLRGFDSSLHRHREEDGGGGRARKSRGVGGSGAANGSDSDSDGSAGRSLDLASSHSSDDEDTSDRRSTIKPAHKEINVGYLPNITEAPQMPNNSRVTHWTPASMINQEGEIGRWSQETGSDNEMLSAIPLPKTPSPNPLPNPDLTSDTVYHLNKHHNMKPSILENIHETYVANIEQPRMPLDNRYGMDPDYTDVKYCLSPEMEKHNEMTYDPHYMQTEADFAMRSNHYRPPYGSKSYLPVQDNYNYSPTKFMNGENGIYGSRDFRDSGIAGFLKSDYQNKFENRYGIASGDFADRLSETSEKHTHDKYLFPYTAEEDHISVRGMNQSPVVNNHLNRPDLSQQMIAPLANMAETSEKSTTEDDAETRV